MEETLEEAVVALFEGRGTELAVEINTPEQAEQASASETTEDDNTTAAPETTLDLADNDIAGLARLASDHYEAAQQALQRGDWATYGEELDKVEAALNALVELTRESE
jgi:uncharacterized membrane protein (UPF0182 family)